jgi:isopentenyl-diphosphate Delta-isomerase
VGRRTASGVEGRKAEHLELSLSESVEGVSGPGWNDVELVHEALPEVDLDEVDLSVELLGWKLRAPVMIAAMTGGHEGAGEVNATLGRAAERHGLAIGVGSQRAALQDPGLAHTYAAVRESAPSAPVVANVGAAQLIVQPGGRPPLGLDDARAAVEMVRADALAVHLNFLEESVQPEGDRRTRGCAEAIGALAAGLEVPVIAKETGAGMARATAERLRALGVRALDVGGAGGTNFAIIERMRAERQGDQRGARLGRALAEWGIPTAVSVAGAAATGLPVIATGGVRSGLDAAKAFALGANVVGIARPFLSAAEGGDDALDAWLGRFLEELRTVLMLSGCRRPGELRGRPRVISGRTRTWLDELGYA